MLISKETVIICTRDVKMISKLSKQQKDILNILERSKSKLRPCEIGRALYPLYGELNPSHRASIARSLKELVKRNLINQGWQRNVPYSSVSHMFNKWCYWID
jgi:hypothetical protein